MIERASILTNTDKIEKNDIFIEPENTGIHEKKDLEKLLVDDYLTLDELIQHWCSQIGPDLAVDPALHLVLQQIQL
ncbi:hypothetical protein E8P77_01190 [Soehngenia saccharolytica]|nr:hypothetical protein E8P77_01190 [Soehngenia saccharolytica]